MLSLLLSANVIACLLLLQLLYFQRTRAKEVCCEAAGCFNDLYPFNSMPLPECTDYADSAPTFNLYTRNDWYNAQLITPSNVPKSYSPENPTYFIAHGWITKGDTKWVLKMKDELLKKKNINVVVIDWYKMASRLWYPQSASNVRSIGAHTALIMKALRAQSDKKAYLYCIGHSLGAHLCAHAGLGIQIDRITGMDPAGPWFEKKNNIEIGLNPSSADFVDVMHTDKTYGTERPIGHVDFYPNGGDNQPGCMASVCSHNIAPIFYIESIKKDCFVALKKCKDHEKIPRSCVECRDCSVMGLGTDSSLSGFLYLETSRKAPYCLSSAA